MTESQPLNSEDTIELLTTVAQNKHLNQYDAIDRHWRMLGGADDPLDDEWMDADLGAVLNKRINRHPNAPLSQTPASIARDKPELLAIGPDGTKSLGPVLRLILIRLYLEQTKAQFGQSNARLQRTGFVKSLLLAYLDNNPIARMNAEAKALKLDQTFTAFDRRLTMTMPPYQCKAVSDPTWETVRHAAVWALSDYHQTKAAFTYDGLFSEQRFSGVDAIKQFWDEISGETTPKRSTALKYVFTEGSERKKVFDSVFSFACDRNLPENASLLATVSCNGSWRDGAAFAQTLEARLKEDPSVSRDDVVRIPLASYTQTDEQNGQAEYVMSYDDLVKKLVVVFGVEAPSPEKGAPFYDLIPTIRAIRDKMAANPRIIIFEGYYADQDFSAQPHQLGTEILKIARDDHFKGLLLRLMEPALIEENEAGALGLETFRKNRFIVVANRPLGYFEDERRKGAAGLTQEKIDPPNEIEMREIIGRSALRYKGALLSAFDPRGSVLKKIIYEPILDVIDKILVLAHGPVAQDADAANAQETLKTLLEMDIFDDVASIEQTLTRLVSHYLDGLEKKNAAVYELHLLLAMVPGGLRHVTLVRMSRRFAALTAPKMAKNLFADLMQKAEVIGDHVRGCEGTLITHRQVDLFHGLDDKLPVFETSVLTNEMDWDAESANSFDIEDPILKEYLNRAILGVGKTLKRRLSSQHMHIVHRMLAEEALSQTTLAFRQRGVDYTPSFRSYRRLVSAIYHSLCSIPLVKKGGQLHVVDDRSQDIACSYFAGSKKPKTFYFWAYIFLYRSIMERAPSWELSRKYALDRLKVDLLEAFDAPWKLPNHPDFGRSSKKGVSLIEGTFCSTHGEVALDYLVNYAYALTAVNEPAQAAKAAKRVRILEQGRIPQGRKLEIQIHKVSMNANMQSETINVEQDWQRLWNTLEVRKDGVGIDWGHRAPVQGDVRTPAQEAGRLRGAVEEQIQEATDAYWGIFKSGASLDDYENLPSVHKGAEKLFRRIGGGEPSTVSEFSHALFQLSDITSEEADLCRSFARVETLSIENGAVTDRLEDIRKRLNNPGNNKNAANPYWQFCHALAIYKLAEQLRMEVFRNDPLGGNFIHSGRAARASIRTCLVLEREARKIRLKDLKPKQLLHRPLRLGLFSREARRTNDRVTRHLFRFPRERASLQIIEASTHRMLSEMPEPVNDHDVNQQMNTFRSRSLEVSWRYLNTAENIVLGLSRKNSIRLHFALERIKLNLAKADVAQDPDSKRNHLGYAKRDASYLTAKALEAGTTIWIIIAAIQVQNVEEEVAKLAKV